MSRDDGAGAGPGGVDELQSSRKPASMRSKIEAWRPWRRPRSSIRRHCFVRPPELGGNAARGIRLQRIRFRHDRPASRRSLGRIDFYAAPLGSAKSRRGCGVGGGAAASERQGRAARSRARWLGRERGGWGWDAASERRGRAARTGAESRRMSERDDGDRGLCRRKLKGVFTNFQLRRIFRDGGSN